MKMSLMFVLATMILAVSATALTPPLPINGKVLGLTVDGIEVEVRNMRTNEYEIVRTNKYGEFLVDAFNFPDGYRSGDVFRVTLTECKNKPECVKSQTFESNTKTPSLYFAFDITNVLVKCPSCPICPTCQVCPTCPECQSCEECEDHYYYEPCPETEENILYALLGALITGVGAVGLFLGKKKFTKEEQDKLGKSIGKELSVGSGVRFFKTKSGTSVKHIHYGIVGYHDPQVSHNNIKYRHERGKLIV